LNAVDEAVSVPPELVAPLLKPPNDGFDGANPANAGVLPNVTAVDPEFPNPPEG
jgi:hypothetical protein